MPLVLTDQDVHSLLSMDEAIRAVEEAMQHQAAGLAANCPRERVMAGPGVYLATMRAADYQSGIFGYKAYTVAGASYRFLVYLYSLDGGRLLAMVQAGRLGQLRTGAATAVATRHMARPDASRVGILGSGFHARTQLEAVCKVRPIESACVYSPTPGHRQAFAREMSARLGIQVTPADSPRQAVESADIVVTITTSAAPVFDGAWLSPGTHIAAVGGADPYMREIDDQTVLRSSTIVVDDLAQARLESGELLMPASRGLLLWERVRELWQVVGGSVPGRRAADDITLFKSLGMALWDIAAARAAYEKAVALGVGTAV